VEKRKKVKPMADMLRSIGITVRGIREVSPEEEKKRFKLEVCGNRFFVPIPSHFNDFIPIPIPFPFPSET